MPYTLQQFIDGIKSNNRRVLGKAITLSESTLRADNEFLAQILANFNTNNKTFRIGLTGPPGVGKSTFIENFGLFLIEKGHKVAVLAVDPSSSINGGSILGDKTRMPVLSAHENAFIRPSPAGDMLGGINRKTRESMLLLEAGGFDIIFVETVGVGQSETLVASMVDLFLVLMLPGAGDELQGIKKGVIEMADIIAVNKADGAMLSKARLAQTQLKSALSILKSRVHDWMVEVELISSIEKQGFEKLFEKLMKFKQLMVKSGQFDLRRSEQSVDWMHAIIKEELKNRFYENKSLQSTIQSLTTKLKSGKVLPTQAAQELLKIYDKS